MVEPTRALTVWLPTVRAGSGADVFVERLAAALERIGHRPVVEWLPHHVELSPALLARPRPPRDADLVHVNAWQGFAYARCGLPLVVTEHHSILDPAFRAYLTPAQALYHVLLIRRYVRASLRAADALSAVSHATAQAMRIAGCTRDVTVIHNWVDTELFKPTPRAPGLPFKLLFVGNPSLRKGGDVPGRVIERLGEGFELLYLGGLRRDSTKGPELPRTKRIARRSAAELAALYREVDAVLVPSRYEGFGYVALEAMSSGCPVVGFDAPGIAEVCVDGETALLSPIDDVEGLVESCRRLANDPALAARLGVAGRARAVEKFRESVAAPAYDALYRRAIAHYAETRRAAASGVNANTRL